MKEVQQQIDDSRHDEHSKTLIESELRKSYNEQNNIKIYSQKEMTKTDDKH